MSSKNEDSYKSDFCKQMKDVSSFEVKNKCYLELNFEEDPIFVIFIFIIFGIGILFCLLVVYYNCYVRIDLFRCISMRVLHSVLRIISLIFSFQEKTKNLNLVKI